MDPWSSERKSNSLGLYDLDSDITAAPQDGTGSNIYGRSVVTQLKTIGAFRDELLNKSWDVVELKYQSFWHAQPKFPERIIPMTASDIQQTNNGKTRLDNNFDFFFLQFGQQTQKSQREIEGAHKPAVLTSLCYDPQYAIVFQKKKTRLDVLRPSKIRYWPIHMYKAHRIHINDVGMVITFFFCASSTNKEDKKTAKKDKERGNPQKGGKKEVNTASYKKK
jgi:hypothetical protein